MKVRNNENIHRIIPNPIRGFKNGKLRVKTIKSKITWGNQAETFITKNVVEVIDIKLPNIIHSREETAKFHVFDKSDGTINNFILGRY